MLQIYFGNRYSKTFYDRVDTNFLMIYEKHWLKSDFAKRVIKAIDHSDVVGESAIYNTVVGTCSPEWLSGGAKTLIAAYFLPDVVFPMRNLGDNCSPFLREIADKQDTKWYVYKYFPDGLDNCNIMFMDWNEKIVNEPEFKKWYVINRPENYELYKVYSNPPIDYEEDT